MFYDQLLNSKGSSYKNRFTTTALLKKRALRFAVWSVGKDCAANVNKTLQRVSHSAIIYMLS